MSISGAPPPAELHAIRAVLFDFAETLFAPEDPTKSITAALGSVNGELSTVDIERLVKLIAKAFESEPFLALEGRMDHSASEHRAAMTAAFAAADAAVDGLTDAIYERMTEPTHWVPFADTRPTLEQLRGGGIRIGVVRNTGFDIRPVFSHHGLIDLVDGFVLSFEHGLVKPDPAIFELAARELRLEPTETLMVGDNMADAGAVRAGMRVYLLPPVAQMANRGLAEVLTLCGAT